LGIVRGLRGLFGGGAGALHLVHRRGHAADRHRRPAATFEVSISSAVARISSFLVFASSSVDGSFSWANPEQGPAEVEVAGLAGLG